MLSVSSKTVCLFASPAITTAVNWTPYWVSLFHPTVTVCSFVCLFFISLKDLSTQSAQPTKFAIDLWDLPLVPAHLDYIVTPLVEFFLHLHTFYMLFQFTHPKIISVCCRFISQGSILILYFKLLQRLLNIQGVTGGTDQTSGECSLGQTIPI